MSQNESRGLAVGAIAISVLSLAASVAALACTPEREQSSAPVTRVITGSAAPAAPVAPATAPQAVTAELPKQDKPAVLSAVAPKSSEPVKAAPAAAELVVKRFVVTSGVERREPVASGQPFVADGKPVYAFAELRNSGGEEQEVSVIFERKGSNQRVGNATLKVPASVPRHRTWANTRYIREPGTWEAVLTSASGAELARTTFDVVAE
jgi:hypothetical protein